MSEEVTLFPPDKVKELYSAAPPILKELVSALLKFENGVDDMGYDPLYYFEDIPTVVEKVLENYRGIWE